MELKINLAELVSIINIANKYRNPDNHLMEKAAIEIKKLLKLDDSVNIDSSDTVLVLTTSTAPVQKEERCIETDILDTLDMEKIRASLA